MSSRRTLRLLARSLPVVLAIACVVVPVAHAGENYGSKQTWLGCGGNKGEGARDRSGRLYSKCSDTKIAIIGSNGVASSAVTVPVGGAVKPFEAVAPTPDGSAVYTVDYGSGMMGVMTLQRLKIDAARTSASLDTTFKPQQFMYGGKLRNVCAYDVATDAYGYIYVSNGGWCTSSTKGSEPTVIVKYAPDGHIVAQFGDFGGPTGGLFNVNMGIDVTPDGRRIYVADHLNTRVQYFDWQLDGTYKYAGAISAVSDGTSTVGLSATYGVALDPWGNIYIADTTSMQVWKLTSDFKYLAKITMPYKVHSISVDARGTVYATEAGIFYPRLDAASIPTSTPAPGPEPKADLLPPVLASISGPARTTESSITVNIVATDDVGVKEVRFADENGEWGAWKAYAPSMTVQLTNGLGYKRVYAQVRDGRQFFSESQFIVVLRESLVVPDTTAPTLSIAAPESVPVAAPIAHLSITASDAIGVTHYRIAREDGTFGEWQPWGSGGSAGNVDVDLGSAPGYRGVYVQVRDAAYNISNTVAATIRVGAAPVDTSGAAAPTAHGAVASAPVSGAAALATTSVVARDSVAPRILTLRTPAKSCSRIVTLRVVARDNVSVVKVRVANEDGRYGAWKVLRGGSIKQRLTTGNTKKRVTVQVADAAGNISAARSQAITVVRCGH